MTDKLIMYDSVTKDGRWLALYMCETCNIKIASSGCAYKQLQAMHGTFTCETRKNLGRHITVIYDTTHVFP